MWIQGLPSPPQSGAVCEVADAYYYLPSVPPRGTAPQRLLLVQVLQAWDSPFDDRDDDDPVRIPLVIRNIHTVPPPLPAVSAPLARSPPPPYSVSPPGPCPLYLDASAPTAAAGGAGGGAATAGPPRALRILSSLRLRSASSRAARRSMRS